MDITRQYFRQWRSESQKFQDYDTVKIKASGDVGYVIDYNPKFLLYEVEYYMDKDRAPISKGTELFAENELEMNSEQFIPSSEIDTVMKSFDFEELARTSFFSSPVKVYVYTPDKSFNRLIIIVHYSVHHHVYSVDIGTSCREDCWGMKYAYNNSCDNPKFIDAFKDLLNQQNSYDFAKKTGKLKMLKSIKQKVFGDRKS